MTKRRPKTTVTYRSPGWLKEPCDAYYPGFKLCSTQNIAVCETPPVWKVEERGGGLLRTGYYCDAHLSDTDRRSA
jgi:hypothetical protein